MSMPIRRINLPEVADHRGRLMFAEESRHIPFLVKRIFAIYDVPAGMNRGGHAHRAQQQFLVMMNGECVAIVDDGADRTTEPLRERTTGLYVPAGLWLELTG